MPQIRKIILLAFLLVAPMVMAAEIELPGGGIKSTQAVVDTVDDLLSKMPKSATATPAVVPGSPGGVPSGPPVDNIYNDQKGLPAALPGSIPGFPQPRSVDFKNLLYQGSIMFSKETLDAIYSALEGIEVKVEAEDIPVTVTQITAPAFYLSSLLYVESDSWTIWVNEKKYTEAGFPALFVDNVTDDYAAFIWQAKSLDTISPNWQNKFEYVTAENNKLTNKEGYLSKNKRMFVDRSGEVYFRLGVNQSFVSRTMEIVEGKVADSVVDVNPAANLGPASATTPVDPVNQPRN